MAELKPCPFCGSEPDHEQTMDESLWSHETVPYRRVRCRQCEIGTDYVCEGYEPTEVEQWNRRATDGQRDTAQGEPICVECNGSGEGVADTTCLRCNGQGGFPQGGALSYEEIRKQWTAALGYSITDAELCVVRQLAAPTPPDGDATREGVNELWYRLRNPMTPFGMLVRTLRSLTGTLLMDMARDLQTTPAELSAYECGRKPIPPELPRYAAQFFARHGIADTLPALTAAMSASKGSDDGR